MHVHCKYIPTIQCNVSTQPATSHYVFPLDRHTDRQTCIQLCLLIELTVIVTVTGNKVYFDCHFPALIRKIKLKDKITRIVDILKFSNGVVTIHLATVSASAYGTTQHNPPCNRPVVPSLSAETDYRRFTCSLESVDDRWMSNCYHRTIAIRL